MLVFTNLFGDGFGDGAGNFYKYHFVNNGFCAVFPSDREFLYGILSIFRYVFRSTLNIYIQL
jgi:hypothetical protein